MDIARGELVEAELDRLIEKRSARKTDPDEQEALWQKSVDAYDEKRRQVARLEWHAFHCGQAERHRRTLERLIAAHEDAAARLMNTLPKGESS